LPIILLLYFFIFDHSTTSDIYTLSLHDALPIYRIDPEVIVRTVLAAGFRLEARSDLLRNPQDSHQLRVFDPAVRGRTDQAILKFRKPASASAAPAATARAPAVTEASGRGSGCAGLCI